jgi:hypothetical protein
MKITNAALAASILLAVSSAKAQTYELIDVKTGLSLNAGEISVLSDRTSDLEAYARLILNDIGCTPGRPAGDRLHSATGHQTQPARPSPCKIQKLYLDPVADGTPEGRALVRALTKTLAKSGRVALVGSRNEAQTLFVDAQEYEIEERPGWAAREARREESSSVADQFVAAGKIGRPRRYIAYVVETDCRDPQVDLTYDVGSDQTEQNTEDAPWAELITYSPGSAYLLSAQKHDGSDYCAVSAEIYSVSLTREQVDLWSNSSGSPVSPIKRVGKKLREADSDSPYGIADVSYSPEL